MQKPMKIETKFKECPDCGKPINGPRDIDVRKGFKRFINIHCRECGHFLEKKIALGQVPGVSTRTLIG